MLQIGFELDQETVGADHGMQRIIGLHLVDLIGRDEAFAERGHADLTSYLQGGKRAAARRRPNTLGLKDNIRLVR